MKISVIVPFYNEESVIEDCLRTLLLQSYKNLEIILIDDGSNDKSVQKLAKFVGREIKLLKQNHKGAGAARNFGVKKSIGEIVVFIDADMTFHKDFIKNLTAPIINGKAVGTFSKEEFLFNKDNVWAKCWNINRGLPIDQMHPKDYPDTQKVFRAILKSEFEKAGGFDGKAGYTDDWSLSDKLGIEALNAPGTIFYHKNPSTLEEVFTQSRWIAKRKYKFGLFGSLAALLRVSLPVSIILGFIYAIKNSLPEFLVYKIVSDAGAFIGILEFVLFGKTYK